MSANNANNTNFNYSFPPPNHPMYHNGYGQWAATNWVPNPAVAYQQQMQQLQTYRPPEPYQHNGNYSMPPPRISPNQLYNQHHSNGHYEGNNYDNSTGRYDNSNGHYDNHYYNRSHGNPNSRMNGRNSNVSNYSRQRDFPENRYDGNNSGMWHNNRNNKYKRGRDENGELHKTKQKNKKKKGNPEEKQQQIKRDWSEEIAMEAFNAERKFNSMFKNPSLIIKFPDLELNKEIVSKFDPAIENVHFQQPSTARFCFVTLKKDSDADAIIKSLNQIKFGLGNLQVEYKKEREDEQVITHNDIDPLTLYVGNLSPDVTKDDIVEKYPKYKRIDIGFAKKMKLTRYAFVNFSNVKDSVEAFLKTRCTEMHGKSMIVRFRRLRGTLGMRGDTKPQNPPKKPEAVVCPEESEGESESPSKCEAEPAYPSIFGEVGEFPEYYNEDDEDMETDSKDEIFKGNLESGLCNEILERSEYPSGGGPSHQNGIVSIKQEPFFDVYQPPPPPPPEPEEEDVKPDINKMPPMQYEEIPKEIFERCKPKVEVKVEVRSDPEPPSDELSIVEPPKEVEKFDYFGNIQIKTEPESDAYDNHGMDEVWDNKSLGIESFS